MEPKSIAVVVIGRNEGERLQRCLRSIPEGVPVVYVDSGSTDGSIAFVRSIGVTAISLDMSIPFTAARARNAGWRHIVVEQASEPEFIQFVDGDCELDVNWLDHGLAAMRAEPGVAAVFGRLRERFPDRSFYNRMCDDEWNVPVGIVAFCGGNALFRTMALQAAGGYSDDLTAGEEPDLCLRLRHMGWFVRRIDAEMGLHDANILTFSDWWRRARRGGFAYAMHVLRHDALADPQWRRQIRSIVFWGLIWPVGSLLAALLGWVLHPLAGLMMLATLAGGYAAQILRIAARKHGSGTGWRFSFRYGALMMIGKFAELSGILRCWMSHALNCRTMAIKYEKRA